MQELEDLDINQEMTTNIESDHTSGEYEDAVFLNHRINRENFLRDYGSLCTDLKQLYVCVTRPKQRLIIYDEDPSRREAVLNYW